MGLSNIVAENKAVEMNVLKSTDQVARKIGEHNIKINIIIINLVLFLLLLIFVVFLTFDKNAYLEKEINFMRKEIQQLKFQCNDKNLMAELEAFEQSQTFNDVTYDGKSYPEKFDFVKPEDREESTTSSSRKKREVLTTTQDGVPVIYESYIANRKLKTSSSSEKFMLYDSLKGSKRPDNKSGERITFETTTKSMDSRENEPSLMFTRMSRVMSTDGKRKLVRKSVRKNGSEENRNIQEQVESIGGTMYPNPGRRRKGHHRNIETMDEYPGLHRRHGTAVHFHGDTTRYHSSRPAHYKGDNRLSHPGGLIESWDHAKWVKTLNMDTQFSLSQDKVTVKDSGLYFIYAQIFYSDKHDTNGFKIVKNNELIAQCVVTSHSSSAIEKANTCFTATVDRIQEGDTVRIQEIGNERISIFEAGKSFFGMVKLADVKK